MSPSLKHHFAALNLAVLDYPTYRIPVSGTEGCFNDLRNDRPATLYLRVAGSGVSSARLLMKKPVSLSCRDEQEFPVCSVW